MTALGTPSRIRFLILIAVRLCLVLVGIWVASKSVNYRKLPVATRLATH